MFIYEQINFNHGHDKEQNIICYIEVITDINILINELNKINEIYKGLKSNKHLILNNIKLLSCFYIEYDYIKYFKLIYETCNIILKNKKPYQIIQKDFILICNNLENILKKLINELETKPTKEELKNIEKIKKNHKNTIFNF